ncbi:MAG: PKD domain-containing protein [Cyclobacteriaceae bacterium]
MKKITYQFMYLLAIVFIGTACSEDEPTVDAPDARFTSVVDGLTVQFTDASVNAESYAWDFGDGNSSTDASPSHTFAEGGDYMVTLTVTNEAGSDETSETITLESVISAADFAGTWVMAPQAGALAVGPAAQSSEWWGNSADDVTTRDCYFDDTYTFDADGNFTIEMGDATWLETWQGVDEDQCGAPAAPHAGGSYTFEVGDGTLKVIGEGAFIGLPKAVNAGELSAETPPAVPGDVTYQIVDLVDDGSSKTMTIYVEAGTGVFWTFTLVSQ